ncbi:MAG: beta-galactosidase [Deltaproteobacteria bacterium]|nr:beta-galactosidase [Deltaproteobacteria bacterium]
MLAASLHYFRLAPQAVAPALEALRRLGIAAVETPVPWSCHERGGGFVFDGDSAHLVALLETAARLGLGVHLRLGPVVGSDLTGLGLPASIAADRDLAARHPDGSPQVVPVPPRWLLLPSCASHAYRERAAAWVAAVASAVAPFAGPAGPLRSLILGDAWPFLGRSPVGAPDHHPDALAAWDAYRAAADPDVRARGLPAALPGPDAPRPARLGLARFAETSYLEHLRDLLRAAATAVGDTVPLAVTLPPAGLFQPVGAGTLAALVDRVGLDAYGWHERPAALDRDARLVAGTAREPFASFVPVGTPPYLPQLDGEDQLHALRSCLAAGLGELVLSMGVARDRWSGGLLDEALREGEPTHVYRRLLHGLTRSGWFAGRRRPVAALVVPRGYVRGALVACAELVGPVAPGFASAAGFDPPAALEPADEGPGGGAWWRWFRAAETALQELGVPYVLFDDEGPAAPDPPLLLAPTLAECPATLAALLRRRVARGATTICGPTRPERDLETGRSLEPLDGLPFLVAPTAETLGSALGTAFARPPRERLERALFVDAVGAPTGLALVHRGSRELPIGLATEGLAPGSGPDVDDGATEGWRDVDEPGLLRAAGSISPGEVRLLVPARKEAP